MSNVNVGLIAAIRVLRELHKLKNKKNNERKRKLNFKRKYWVKPLLMKRNEHSLEAHLFKDIVLEDNERDFQNFTRLSIDKFEELLSLVQGCIAKQNTVQREAITPRTKLAITLRYLATGDSFKTLEFLSRVSKSTISMFVPHVLQAVFDSLRAVYLKVPSTEMEWLQIASDFNKIWQFPHTLGALDGKHIRIKAPAHSGSQFYNFKGFYSIVLFALVDANGKFLFIDVGCNGKASDSTIYQDGYLYKCLKDSSLNIPADRQLVPEYVTKTPYFFIGDDAFCLDKNLMKPYNRNMKLTVPQEMFNYRLCRARMVVECAFGKLARRFNIFQRPIEVLPSTVDKIVLASCALHNFLAKTATMPQDLEQNATQPQTFSSIGLQEYSTYRYANRIRDEISRYCVTDGDVDFQWWQRIGTH